MNEFDKIWNETMGCGACEDCISRQAVLDKKELVELEDGQSFYCINPKDVETLPSVTPQPKVGEWIFVHPLQEDDEGAYMCSCCGVGNWGIDPKVDKYCFNCGADMRGDKNGNT